MWTVSTVYGLNPSKFFFLNHDHRRALQNHWCRWWQTVRLTEVVIFNSHTRLWHHRASKANNRDRLYPLRHSVLFSDQPHSLPLVLVPWCLSLWPVFIFLALTSGHNGLVCRWRSINLWIAELAILPQWVAHNTATPMPNFPCQCIRNN